MPVPLDRNKLKDALIADTRAAFQAVREQTAGQTLYVFGLISDGEGMSVGMTANTEEALLVCAEGYASRYKTPLESCCVWLRWSPGNWRCPGADTDCFAATQALLSAGWDDDFSEYHYDTYPVYQVCFEVLAQLRNEGLFGSEAEGTMPLLNFFLSDQHSGQRYDYAKLLNPGRQAYQYAVEMREGEEASRKILR